MFIHAIIAKAIIAKPKPLQGVIMEQLLNYTTLYTLTIHYIIIIILLLRSLLFLLLYF